MIRMTLRNAGPAVLILIVSGCGIVMMTDLRQKFGEPSPRERVVQALAADDVDYWSDVKPILEQRCVVCHGCYDAPCQLKLGSIEGIERGASSAVVYDQSRLTMAQPTRLFEDAQTVAGWRVLGFHPVLNEYPDTIEANRQAGVMHRILTLKDENPLPTGAVLPKSFDLDLDRKEFCAKPETFDEYARTHPLWGMPYALPGIEPDRQATLLRWLEQGASYTERPPLPAAFRNEVLAWEAFLNGGSLKHQLAARYIYEHLFLSHLYFPDLDDRRFFRIIRSATPPGEPVNPIATRRPYNDPGVNPVYYRIVEEREAIVAKTHMPYALHADRKAKWREWFLEADYEVSELPSYDQQSASNPFVTFDAMPVRSRYRFMLDDAKNTINAFMKGPVCRGQVALNVINDRFWVFFIDPDNLQADTLEDFLASNAESMTLPASTESIFRPITHWRQYSKQQTALLAAVDRYLTEHYGGRAELSLNLVWDGDGVNDNAALTIFRHFDSATVERGLIGQPPKTAWLIGYALLERIHYLLTAGYDVFGNAGHQLLTRVYMDFLRMEGETAFLLLLPKEARERERAYWYREADDEVRQYMALPRFESRVELAIDYKTDDPKQELFQLLEDRLRPVLPTGRRLSAIADPAVRGALSSLENLVGQAVTLMPQTTFVEIRGKQENLYVTLLSDNAHLNITSLFGEKKFRAPDEDRLTVVNGLLGAYPNAFLVIEDTALKEFAQMVASMRRERDYAALLDRFGIRRTSPDFWRRSDAFHAAFRADQPVEYGLLDYNRLENR